ncbi:MAG TPA: cell envelope integrity EipB family protein [Acetobacteraceae bacterium]|jgi:hypothetical protein|nr:cell envelope integrity EipB family protein [Acetobacteraceae bacterium]
MPLPARLAAVFFLLGPGFLPHAAGAAPAPPPTRAPVPLAAHRALYELTRDNTAPSRGGREIASAHGTMGYEVADVCDGWATRQRLNMTITNADGQDTDMDSDYATWESKDGLNFRFHMVQKSDTAVTNQTDGSAHLSRTGGPGEVEYRLPKETKTALPAGTLFPMMHTIAIINAAREGKKFLALPLFDGTDDDGYEYSSIAVMDWKPPFQTQHSFLNTLASTRVRIAFFDHAKEDTTPTYEVAMRYWENGVADNMVMDFEDFVMSAKLTELTPLPKRC